MQTQKSSSAIRIDHQHFDMPSVPIVLTKILQLVDDNEASARKLEELILHDQSLSVRILKLSNSAFYSFRSEVKTISHAITLLGLNLVRSLAIGVSIFESFTKGMREEAALFNGLWMHSFGVGALAQEIWSRRGTRAQGEFALLCGLLHDLGKVVFFKKDRAGYARLFGMEKGPEDPAISDFELQRYDVDHASLGASLAKEWRLPADLSMVVRRHHDPGGAGHPLVAAVAMADALVKQAGIGYDGDSKVTANVPQLQLVLNMSQEELDQLSALTVSKRADVEDFFNLVL